MDSFSSYHREIRRSERRRVCEQRRKTEARYDFFYLWLWRGVGAVVMGVVVFLSVGAIELLARLP